MLKGLLAYMSVILITEDLVHIIECLCFEGAMAPASGRDSEIKDWQILRGLSSSNLMQNNFICVNFDAEQVFSGLYSEE